MRVANPFGQILKGGLRGLASGGPLGLTAGLASGLTSGLGGRRRRRRRKRLTASDIAELNNIKNILGKTAAANALPFYLK